MTELSKQVKLLSYYRSKQLGLQETYNEYFHKCVRLFIYSALLIKDSVKKLNIDFRIHFPLLLESN